MLQWILHKFMTIVGTVRQGLMTEHSHQILSKLLPLGNIYYINLLCDREA